MTKKNNISTQYNAIVVFRILAENPGQSFTRNINATFVDTITALLRSGKDASVQQILRETLLNLEMERSQDPGVQQLLRVWRLNKNQSAIPLNYPITPTISQSQYQKSQQPASAKFPPPEELSLRIEEARNTAKILTQLVQTTPQSDVLSSDLMIEFTQRCQTAQRSMQSFINCAPPDDDTLQNLIEVNEQLNLSIGKCQRAVLNARRLTTTNNGSNTSSPNLNGQQASNLNGQRTSNLNGQQASNINLQQASSFNGQQISNLNGQQASGFNTQQASSFNNQRASSYIPQQPSIFNGQQASSFNGQQAPQQASSFNSQQVPNEQLQPSSINTELYQTPIPSISSPTHANVSKSPQFTQSSTVPQLAELSNMSPSQTSNLNRTLGNSPVITQEQNPFSDQADSSTNGRPPIPNHGTTSPYQHYQQSARQTAHDDEPVVYRY